MAGRRKCLAETVGAYANVRYIGKGWKAMLARERRRVVLPADKPRKRGLSHLLAILRNPFVDLLLVAMAVTSVLLLLVSAYAKATENGYERNRLILELRDLDLEIEAAIKERDKLRIPQRAEAFAQSYGMQQGKMPAIAEPLSSSNIACDSGHEPSE